MDLREDAASLWSRIAEERENQKGPGHSDTIQAKHSHSFSQLLWSSSDMLQTFQNLAAVDRGESPRMLLTIKDLIPDGDGRKPAGILNILQDVLEAESARETPYYNSTLEEKQGYALRSYLLRDRDAKIRIIETLYRYVNSNNKRLGDDLLRITQFWASLDQWPSGPEHRMEELVKTRKGESGIDDDHILGLKYLLAMYYVLQRGRESKAISAWTELAGLRSVYGPTHPDTLEAEEVVNFALKMAGENGK
ncbi:hypothetical protein CPB86DRAFT_814746 [Serendipita vermifera]|nr:hypothetical protein CPB86DRAFT_814746 [Serendipita vermifera]